ncbi:MAG: hypothetical protein AVDCRST_MAG95-135 [uncultured Adhaeribacter sp.]|uniref:Uncharacterized protein n=1 Tax=uncultured Adhaeribacter sp. TaxID=448109 RepID=A0A6J4H190_9BACT|nr:MAG: hypothetical protein AVDCRST_MAG95-135 [uncultured Adhaeribacter sp.]
MFLNFELNGLLTINAQPETVLVLGNDDWSATPNPSSSEEGS